MKKTAGIIAAILLFMVLSSCSGPFKDPGMRYNGKGIMGGGSGGDGGGGGGGGGSSSVNFPPELEDGSWNNTENWPIVSVSFDEDSMGLFRGGDNSEQIFWILKKKNGNTYTVRRLTYNSDYTEIIETGNLMTFTLTVNGDKLTISGSGYISPKGIRLDNTYTKW
jgi:hypothetical protein